MSLSQGMEKYSLKMQEQLAVQFAEQQRKWEAEMRKRMEEVHRLQN